MYELDNVGVSYSGAQALVGIDLNVQDGESLAVIGRNGAGKSTLLRVLAGACPPSSGHVRYEGKPLVPNSVHAAKSGIRLVPESNCVFPDLSVLENLQSGGPQMRKTESAQAVEESLELFPVLAPLLDRKAKVLSGGERQVLGVARALVAKPNILLVDEPTLGVSISLAARLLDHLAKISKDRKMTLVVAEQNAALVLKVCDFACWLDTGHIRQNGTSEEVEKALSEGAGLI